MKLPRRNFLHLAASAGAMPAVSRIAWAQAYPTRPVHIIVGFPGGSASDTTARLIGQWLSERLGPPFVIENRPGAASNLAAEAVVRAPPDGYTLLLVTSVNAINANLGFDFIRDLAPVARLVQGPGVMEVNPAFPAKTVPEFIAYAKAHRLAIMGNVGNPLTVLELGELQAAARPLGLQLETLEIRRPQDIASALDAVKGRADALTMSVKTWLRGPTGSASTPWRWPRACRL